MKVIYENVFQTLLFTLFCTKIKKTYKISLKAIDRVEV